MNPTPLQLLVAAKEIAAEAGKIQLGFFRSGNLHADTKLNESDIVTEADRMSETVIINHITSRYPDHDILSEESAGKTTGSPYRWIIDPLDGTTNFRSGLPLFSVSIAVEYLGETVAAVVHAPYSGETFCAVKGQGATLNGQPIHHSSTAMLKQAVVATGFPVDKDTNPDNNLDNVSRLLPHIRGLRRLGSAAIDICYCAAGFLEAYWELNLHRWDVAAGLLIASEAGCRWGEFRQGRNISVIVASPLLYNQITPFIK